MRKDINHVHSRWARVVIRTLIHDGERTPEEAVAEACLLARALRAAHAYRPPEPDKIVRDVEVAARNRAIRDAFRGDNYAELARKYRLHPRTVRKILARG